MIESAGPAADGVGLLFPGQGAQQPRMGAGLRTAVPGFDTHFHDALSAWDIGTDHLIDVWLARGADSGVDDALASQPLLFALNYALGRSVVDRGVTPKYVLGHSVGEVVAAVLAEVMSLADAAAIMSSRLAHLNDAPEGIMLAVSASPTDVEPFLSAHVTIGALNAARQVVLVGARQPMIEAEHDIREAGFITRRARSNLPFHSPILLEAALRAVPDIESRSLRPPVIPIVSGYTGVLLTDEEATSPTYWARQPAAPVHFSAALATLVGLRPSVIVECGPGQSLSSITRRIVPASMGIAVAPLLPARSGNDAADVATFQRAEATVAASVDARNKGIQEGYTDVREPNVTVGR